MKKILGSSRPVMRLIFSKPGQHFYDASIIILIGVDRFDVAQRFINGVLTEDGPLTKPHLKGIHFTTMEVPHMGRIIVKFPDWATEWEGSLDDIKLMAAMIADHLNLFFDCDDSDPGA